MYTKTLPRMDKLVWLARLARPFPTNAGHILKLARGWNFNKSTIDFVKLFPEDEEFKTMRDFVNRSEELELLIREERKMPAEKLRSPQG